MHFLEQPVHSAVGDYCSAGCICERTKMKLVLFRRPHFAQTKIKCFYCSAGRICVRTKMKSFYCSAGCICERTTMKSLYCSAGRIWVRTKMKNLYCSSRPLFWRNENKKLLLYRFLKIGHCKKSCFIVFRDLWLPKYVSNLRGSYLGSSSTNFP